VKNSLRSIIVISILWLAALAMQSSAIVTSSLLDHVLPARVLSNTTPQERQHIAYRLKRLQAPGSFSWAAAGSVLLLSSYVLWTANRPKGSAR
jgi:hypothetical protein